MTLTYSFPPNSQSWWVTNYGAGEQNSYASLVATERSAVRSALQAWSNVANVSFDESVDNQTTVGELRFAWTSGSVGEQAHGYYPSNDPSAGDVWLNSNADWDGFGKGSYGYLTLMHEIGHALGLKHPFGTSPYNNALLNQNDDVTYYTIMSYGAVVGSPESTVNYNPTTPMWYDIAAAQYLYGANTNYHSGANTYTFVQGRYYNQTIWDAGGIDKIVWDATTQGTTIDLRSSYWSDLGNSLTFYRPNGSFWFTSKLTVIIFDGVVIENAVGGGANDLIRGNSADNSLSGAGGADRLSGAEGDDVLIGGTGADKCAGGTGADRFKFNKVSDSTLSAKDLITGFDSSDVIDLSAIDAKVGIAGNQAFTFIGGHGFTGHRGELRYANGFLSGDVDGDRVADFSIDINLSGITKLTAQDIIE